jgi:putative hydroxymethylpyrimidine transporter CytX
VVILMGLGGPLVVVRQWLEKAGIWIVLVTAVWMLVYAATHLDLGAAVARPGDGSLTFAQGIDLVVVMPVSWLPIVGDFNRFARNTRSAFWGTVIGNGVTNISFYALGVVLALYLPEGDLVGSILAIAFGAAGLILLLGDESDNAFADVYSAAMSVKNIRPGLPTRWLVAAIGAVALAIALTFDLGQYQGFLYLVGALFVPLYGVLFADYFLLKRGRRTTADYYPDEATSGEVSLPAFVAWGVGIATYWAVITFAPWLGGTLPSLAASLVMYVVLGRWAPRLRRWGRQLSVWRFARRA